MTRLKSHRSVSIVRTMFFLAVIAGAALVQAQVYTELYNFDCVKVGCNPNQPGLLAQGQDGGLYSTMPTQISGDGTVIGCSLAGPCNTIFQFTDVVSGPNSGLSLGFDGNFYGTTETGGAGRTGTVFKVSGGAMTPLYYFTDDTNGAYPWAPPVQAPDGNIYGATNSGSYPGIAYKITPSGVFSKLATLPSETQAPFIVGSDGNLYGTTPYGGDFNRGTVFQMTTKGKVKIIHNFGADGVVPIGPVMQASDGRLYGTTSGGGSFSQGIVFQVTTGGAYKVLHNFQTATEGTGSTSGLVQGSDKFLYGVIEGGGINGLGSLYKVNTTGTFFAVLHSFDKLTGGTPFSTPTLHTNGTIYGVTHTGGSQNSAYGVLYSFDAGLKPFASLVVIWSGKVGTQVGILGQGFSSATGMKFGTGAGTFSVVSDTYMIATAAPGATTGNVTVLEPSGNLITPQVFRVIPQALTFAPPSGPVGTQVVITGMSLTQTTSVTFGGVKATILTVNSDTQVTATVPTGAKTGKIVVTTKGGTATAPGTFTVN